MEVWAFKGQITGFESVELYGFRASLRNFVEQLCGAFLSGLQEFSMTSCLRKFCGKVHSRMVEGTGDCVCLYGTPTLKAKSKSEASPICKH